MTSDLLRLPLISPDVTYCDSNYDGETPEDRSQCSHRLPLFPPEHKPLTNTVVKETGLRRIRRDAVI
jgi:hypothetical protein